MYGSSPFGTDDQKLAKKKQGRTGAGLGLGGEGAFATDEAPPPPTRPKPRAPPRDGGAFGTTNTFGTDDNAAAAPKVRSGRTGTALTQGSATFGTDDNAVREKAATGRTGKGMEKGRAFAVEGEYERVATGRTGKGMEKGRAFAVEGEHEKAATGGRTGQAMERGHAFAVDEEADGAFEAAAAALCATVSSPSAKELERMEALGELRDLVVARGLGPSAAPPPFLDKALTAILPACFDMLGSGGVGVAVGTDMCLRDLLRLVRLRQGVAKIYAAHAAAQSGPTPAHEALNQHKRAMLVGYYGVVLGAWGSQTLKKDADTLKRGVEEAIKDKCEPVKVAGALAFAELNAVFLPQGNLIFVNSDSRTKKVLLASEYVSFV